MGLVKGFTDIIAPQNLATNGNFNINQRGLFHGSLQDVKLNDYVVDAWYCSDKTVDSLKLQTRPNNAQNPGGFLYFTGHGKKGQIFSIVNVGALLSGHDVTASVMGWGYGDSVPLKILPEAFSYTGNTLKYQSKASDYILKPGTGLQQFVRATYRPPWLMRSPSAIFVELMADGDFKVGLSNFSLIDGVFVNPPKMLQSHPADDLLRCKRYYQSGSGDFQTNGVDPDGLTWRLTEQINFPVEMAAIPTISTTQLDVYETGSGTVAATLASPGLYTLDCGWPTTKKAAVRAYKQQIGALPNKLVYNWFATV